MEEKITYTKLAAKLWLFSALNLSIIITTAYLFTSDDFAFDFIILLIAATLVGSVPAFIALLIALPFIRRVFDYKTKTTILLIVFLFVAIPYGLLLSFISQLVFDKNLGLTDFTLAATCIGAVFLSAFISYLTNIKYIKIYFESPYKNIQIMEENLGQLFAKPRQTNYSNKLWIKGSITAALILLMLIPTVFVSNLVEERQARQEEVKNEVSSKWAGEQSITFPYLFIPYNFSFIGSDNKPKTEVRSFIILPENLNVNGTVSTEQRKRSIYSVLLYNSSLNAKGNFIIQIPNGIDTSTINWNDAKICFGISDFKGIEQKITTNFNNVNYDLSAGLPTNELNSTGLSSAVTLTANDVGKNISFEMPLKIKGTDQLHFSPFAGNSNFVLKSDWNSPSFDGNSLPNERSLDNHGFEANWNFNKANLPFNTVLKDFNFKKDDYSFGVSLIQPADQYAKTMRSVKYAILFIGLTFSLFFIVEIMQKKPFHPLQYVLVGLALVIFFTLLLSISEFILFDYAYLIASVATVSLITLYAKSHFKNWSVASVFAGVIGLIYGFIFILIRLEDTALLVGSIGLFIILAIAMYASRKVNWYGNTLTETVSI